MKTTGRPCGTPPYGYKIHRRGDGSKRLVPDPDRRRIGVEIVRVRDNRKVTWEAVVQIIQQWIDDTFYRTQSKQWLELWRPKKHRYGLSRCYTVYHLEKALQEKEVAERQRREAIQHALEPASLPKSV